MAAVNINLSKENIELKKSFPDFASGDTVNVHIKIKEGSKERIQQLPKASNKAENAYISCVTKYFTTKAL